LLRYGKAMNASLSSERCAVALVDIIDFKWLMAHEGHSVHVERIQQDPVYAQDRLALAAASPTAALRQVAASLRSLLPPAA
jgi:hypothetical protein